MTSAPVLDRLTALADATRLRLLLCLERHELTVGELCQVLQTPQSTVSRHLKVLGDEGWVVSRAEGTSRWYAMAPRLDLPAKRLWQVVRDQTLAGGLAEHDAERLRAVLDERRVGAREFFATSAGQWDTMRAELFGDRAELLALLALLDPSWTVGDLGCGAGQLAAALAPVVGRVLGVDASRQMLAAARRRTAELANVDLRHGDLEALPIEDAELDVAVVSLVLHYLPDPLAALREARRVLRPGGRILVVETLAHDREDLRRQLGHVWLGFHEEQLADWLREAGFTTPRLRRLPPDPKARGPVLVAATAAVRSP